MSNSSKYNSVNEYIADQPKVNQKLLKELRKIILSVVPDAEELFNYGVPAFALIKGGKRDQQIMIAGFKKHIGLYPHPTVMEKFDEELSSYKRGTGSVQFPLDQPLPEELITRMVKYRLELLIQKE